MKYADLTPSSKRNKKDWIMPCFRCYGTSGPVTAQRLIREWRSALFWWVDQRVSTNPHTHRADHDPLRLFVLIQGITGEIRNTWDCHRWRLLSIIHGLLGDQRLRRPFIKSEFPKLPGVIMRCKNYRLVDGQTINMPNTSLPVESCHIREIIKGLFLNVHPDTTLELTCLLEEAITSPEKSHGLPSNDQGNDCRSSESHSGTFSPWSCCHMGSKTVVAFQPHDPDHPNNWSKV